MPSSPTFANARRVAWSVLLCAAIAASALFFLLAHAPAAQADPGQGANPNVMPGAATASCSYNDSTSTLHWSGAAAGWSRDNLDWTLTVIDPFTGTTINALTHNGVFYNATGGTTPSYSDPISGSAWEIQMEVTGPGGTSYGYCYTN